MGMAPVKERIFVLMYKRLSEEAFMDGIARWNQMIKGRLSEKTPRTEWRTDIPTMPDGSPQLEKISVACQITRQYEAKAGTCRTLVQLRSDGIAFNLIGGGGDVGRFESLLSFATEYLSVWQQATGIQTYVNPFLHYVNVFSEDLIRPFQTETAIFAGKMFRMFDNLPFKDAPLSMPYRHEFSLSWRDRDPPAYLDVTFCMPKKRPVEVDLQIMARVSDSAQEMAGEICLATIAPALHEYVLEVFQSILTIEVLTQCGVRYDR